MMTPSGQILLACVFLVVRLSPCFAQFGCGNADGSVDHYYTAIESVTVGEVIGKLHLKGGPKDLVLTPTRNQYLALNQTTRQIYITSPLDFETNNKLKWEIACREANGPFRGELKLKITVIVMDDNDNAPVFLQQHYYANVSEALREGGTVIAGISATDRDSGGQQVVTFSLVPGPYSDYFTIPLPLQGEVKLLKKVDYERITRLDVVIQAKDEHARPLKSYANLTVFVEDEDDLNPVFSRFKYTATVSDNHPQNDSIKTDQPISAKDGDVTINDSLFFSIWDSQEALSIDRKTAAIRITKSLIPGDLVAVIKAEQTNNADRYSTAILNLNVTRTIVTMRTTSTTHKASTSRAPTTPTTTPTPTTTTTTIPTTRAKTTSLSTLPVPVFPSKRVYLNVTDDTPRGRVIGVIGLELNQARKSLWLFELLTSSATFSVHPTGAISLLHNLDRFVAREHLLRLRVTDLYERTATCDVSISILDAIKRPPEVTNDNQPVTINRVADVPVAKIEIRDTGQVMNLSYTLSPQEMYFSINKTGVIFTTKKIVRMESEVYLLWVVIKDNRVRPMATVATVNFTLSSIGKLEEPREVATSSFEAVIALGVLCGIMFIVVVVLAAYIVRRRLNGEKRMSKVRAIGTSDAAGLRYKHTVSADFTNTYARDDISSDGATTVVEDPERVEAINGALVSSLEDFGDIDIETDNTLRDLDYDRPDNSQRDAMKTFGERRPDGYTNGDLRGQNGVHHNSLMPWPHTNGLHKSTSSELETTIAPPINDKPEITVYF